jgi:V8-like Glu-specific endopeptidase
MLRGLRAGAVRWRANRRMVMFRNSRPWSVLPPDDDGDGEIDDRDFVPDTSISPYDLICSLHSNIRYDDGRTGTSHGTGFLVGPQLLVTAAHNVRGNTSGALWRAVDFTISPGRFESYSPAPSQEVPDHAAMTSPRWTDTGPWDDDVAVIKLPGPFYPATRSFFRLLDGTTSAAGRAAMIAGYPATLLNNDQSVAQELGGLYMYAAGRKIGAEAARRLFYKIDTTAGQSGAPVMLMNGEFPSLEVVGLHNKGVVAGHNIYPQAATHNSAVRFTASQIEWIKGFL